MDPGSSLTFYEEEEAAEDDDLEFIAAVSFLKPITGFSTTTSKLSH